ncbi:MAG TPA: NAD-dependent epimerase/dehydratase family protein [Gemmatimonadales bacterium]|nr:NAD-dependent epimerase/dehydratase family protein [Gemmatimonadales bacterium]
MPAQRILITGAAGFIGSHLVDRLLARGDVVTGVDNFDPYYAETEKRANLRHALRSPRFRLVEADCADAYSLDSALEGGSFDVCVHLAAKAGVRASLMDPLGFARANVGGTQVMLEYTRARGIRRFVFASSSSVYGNAERIPFSEDDPAVHPVSPYAATKRAGELSCHAHHHVYGGSLVALRFFTVYGPRQRPDLAIRRFATLMLAGRPVPMFGDGSTERDYTWIADILAGTVAAIDWTGAHPSEFAIINLGGNRTTALKRLIAQVAKELGLEPQVEQVPPQPGDVLRTWADLTRARRLLAYRPTTTLEVGIPRFLAWLKTRQADPELCASARPITLGATR